MQFLRLLLWDRNRVLSLNLLAIVHFQFFVLLDKADAKNPVCNTPECQKMADVYLKNMNPQVKPCDDFYAYACQRWVIQNPRPESEAVWSVATSVQRRALHNVKQLLEDEKPSGVKEFEEAKTLYRKCMKIPWMDKVDPVTLKGMMSKIGKWPFIDTKTEKPVAFFPSWTIDKEYLQLAGESAFFEFTIESEDVPGKFVPVVKRMLSPYGALVRSEDWSNPRELTFYRNFLKSIVKRVGTHTTTSLTKIDEMLEEVIRFRERLRRDIANAYEIRFRLTTIGDFQEWYDKQIKGKEDAKIDWLEIFRAVYENRQDSDTPVLSTETPIKVQLNYISKVADILLTTPKRTIANHVHLYFAERHMQRTPQMVVDLKESTSSNIMSGSKIRYDQERWKTCIEDHTMKVTLGRMYVKEYFPKTNTIGVYSLIEQTKQILIQELSVSKWLDVTSKKSAIDKIKHLSNVIGAPRYYWQPPKAVELDIPGVNPIDVEAYYSADINVIFVSAAFLQWPMYSLNLPYVVDFGSTVAVLAHELFHAVDAGGLKYNKSKFLIKWPLATSEEFKRRANCFKKQYRDYMDREFKKNDVPTELQMLTPSTLNEDVADVMGLKLAYSGYMKNLVTNNGTCAVLPGFEELGCDKLFFIAYANTFCTASTTGAQDRSLLFDEHSAPRVRVNGAVANMKEFSEAFNCTATSQLKLEHTCDMWK